MSETPSTAAAVFEALRARLARGEWAVGDRLPSEHGIAKLLGVSRPAVREALSALSHIGLIEARRGSGTYVRAVCDPIPMLAETQVSGTRHIFEVQLALDMQGARLAARRRTDADIAELTARFRTRQRYVATDNVEYARTDSEFHLAIIEAAHNPMLTEVYRFFRGSLEQSIRAVRTGPDGIMGSDDDHRALLDAVVAGDPDAAAEAAERIVRPTLIALDAMECDATR